MSHCRSLVLAGTSQPKASKKHRLYRSSSGTFLGWRRVLDGVLDDLPGGGVGEVDAAHVGEADQVEQHVGELLAEVLLLGLVPVREALPHLPFPHEQL